VTARIIADDRIVEDAVGQNQRIDRQEYRQEEFIDLTIV
jgi:hypothetical protein